MMTKIWTKRDLSSLKTQLEAGILIKSIIIPNRSCRAIYNKISHLNLNNLDSTRILKNKEISIRLTPTTHSKLILLAKQNKQFISHTARTIIEKHFEAVNQNKTETKTRAQKEAKKLYMRTYMRTYNQKKKQDKNKTNINYDSTLKPPLGIT